MSNMLDEVDRIQKDIDSLKRRIDDDALYGAPHYHYDIELEYWRSEYIRYCAMALKEKDKAVVHHPDREPVVVLMNCRTRKLLNHAAASYLGNTTRVNKLINLKIVVCNELTDDEVRVI